MWFHGSWGPVFTAAAPAVHNFWTSQEAGSRGRKYWHAAPIIPLYSSFLKQVIRQQIKPALLSNQTLAQYSRKMFQKSSVWIKYERTCEPQTEDWLESSWGIFSGVCLNTSGFSPLTFHCDQPDFQKWIWWAEQLQSVDSEAFIFNHFSHLLRRKRKKKSLRRSIGKQTTACANTAGNIILHCAPKHRVQ